jgi:cellulose synthase/poly-beta-1,6-N-acetylglucosamine synthase-like glycosyltransferase
VEVLERHHASERGKGYALEAGLLHLATQPPEYVVIFDADCRFGTGSLDALLSDCEKVQLPTQAVYLPGIRQDGSVRSQWATFALRFKNEARPSGLYQLGMSCLLLGSGMAFSWKVVRAVSWGTGNIVEDMRLGIDLAIAGYSPRFCPHARVTSDAPPSDQAAQKQRTRWEHGHVSTLLTQTPRLLLQALRQLRPRLLGLALELSVPPLSLLVLGLIGLIGLSGLSWWLLEGSAIPLFAGVIALTSLILTIFLAWCKYGRGIVPIGSLLLIPVYLLWKVPIYLRLVGRRERNWVRTDRA